MGILWKNYLTFSLTTTDPQGEDSVTTYRYTSTASTLATVAEAQDIADKIMLAQEANQTAGVTNIMITIKGTQADAATGATFASVDDKVFAQFATAGNETKQISFACPLLTDFADDQETVVFSGATMLAWVEAVGTLTDMDSFAWLGVDEDNVGVTLPLYGYRKHVNRKHNNKPQ